MKIDSIEKDKRATNIEITENDLITQAQQNSQPYVLEFNEVAWWSIFSVGQ